MTLVCSSGTNGSIGSVGGEKGEEYCGHDVGSHDGGFKGKKRVEGRTKGAVSVMVANKGR